VCTNNLLNENEIEAAVAEVRKLFSVNVDDALSRCLLLCDAVKKSDDYKRKSEIYHLTGLAFHHIGKYESALEWYFKAVELKQATADEKGAASTLNNIGLVYIDTSRFKEAVEYLEQSVTLKLKLNDAKSLAAGYENLGVAYQKQLLYKEAIEKYYASLKISESNNDQHRMAITYQNIGNTHLAQGDDAEALKNFEKALVLKQSTNDYQHILQLLNNVAVANKHLGETSKALDYYQQCMAICKENNYSNELSTINNNIGEILLSENKLDEAIIAYKKSIELASIGNNISDLMVAEMNLGIAFLKKENYQDSETYLLSSLEKYANTSQKQGVYDLYQSLISLYEKKGDLQKAIRFFKSYDQLKYEQLNSENSKIINELKTKYEVDKKEKENEISRLRKIELKDALEDLTIEKRRSEKLLLNILPEEIAYELKRSGKVKAQYFESVSVLFADIKNFTTHSETLSPETLVGLLDFYFQLFDNIMQQHDIEKIKTIGDAYLCVCGLPNINTEHAVQIVTAALQMHSKVTEENNSRKVNGLPFFEFRFGIHSGAVIAGIVGKTKFEYDIWGDTVNTAARMEQSGETGRINISETTFELVKEKFKCIPRGKISAKNKGEMEMYFVESVD